MTDTTRIQGMWRLVSYLEQRPDGQWGPALDAQAHGYISYWPNGHMQVLIGAVDCPGGFRFEPRMHDNGEKVVLGTKIRAGGGKKDGEQILDLLAKHPSTSRFIATKLSRRFVADEPPAAHLRQLPHQAERRLHTGQVLRRGVQVVAGHRVPGQVDAALGARLGQRPADRVGRIQVRGDHLQAVPDVRQPG